MELADAVAADELWGWPVAVLDRLLGLRRQAWKGEVSLEQWREQDAATRAGLPGVDLDEVRQFQQQWIKEWIVDRASDDDGRLTGRLTVMLNPAPGDEELWQELAGLHEALGDRRQDRQLREIHQSHRERVVVWLTRPGGGIDPVTGLPWAHIARYRVIEDPDLGPVPQYVDSARQFADETASAEDRQRAEMVRDWSADRKLAAARARLEQNQLTWLPNLLHDGAEYDPTVQPLLADLARIWVDPRVQRLLQAETSRGWPAEVSPQTGSESSGT